MNTTAEHAEQNCGHCTLLIKLTGWFCNAHDLPLRSDNRGAIRCADCIRDHSRNTDKERND